MLLYNIQGITTSVLGYSYLSHLPSAANYNIHKLFGKLTAIIKERQPGFKIRLVQRTFKRFPIFSFEANIFNQLLVLSKMLHIICTRVEYLSHR